ncbi:MAG TPA: MmcQ/YjbR family DNA-binding protein [Acidimicrobiales bacterium]|nr:MmcQ/YjbR family DNA-binding protein [Acidimicrobiales bacterium]
MDVPRDTVAALRAMCLGLPEAYEEEAWVGTRWSIRKKTFAHVLAVESGWPPAYARAAGSAGPITVLTVRTPAPELYRGQAEPPFFWPGWFSDLVGIVLDDRVDWDEVAELVTESYCVLAPKKLVAIVDARRRSPGGATC